MHTEVSSNHVQILPSSRLILGFTLFKAHKCSSLWRKTSRSTATADINEEHCKTQNQKKEKEPLQLSAVHKKPFFLSFSSWSDEVTLTHSTAKYMYALHQCAVVVY